ncbi:MAG: hypothetical protein M3R15_15360 [Acidobacteriota bacterium]|nr:hypothetical protein [Acidobacteriota bacterium]
MLMTKLMLSFVVLASMMAGTTMRPAQDATGTDGEGFIRTWLILAPIPSESEDSGSFELDKAQIKSEAMIKPKDGDKATVGGKELVWKKHTAPGYYVDFKGFVGQGQSEDVVGYAVAYVVADAEMKDLKLQMGSNDQAKVYLNGKQLIKFDETRTLEKDQNSADNVVLNKGTNVLILKVANQKNDWQGAIRFTDKAGAAVKNVKVTLTPQ